MDMSILSVASQLVYVLWFCPKERKTEDDGNQRGYPSKTQGSGIFLPLIADTIHGRLFYKPLKQVLINPAICLGFIRLGQAAGLLTSKGKKLASRGRSASQKLEALPGTFVWTVGGVAHWFNDSNYHWHRKIFNCVFNCSPYTPYERAPCSNTYRQS